MIFGSALARIRNSAALLSLLLFGPGCVTAEMWQVAPPATVVYSAIVGVSDVKTTESSPGAKRLLVSYGEVTAAVPLDGTGSPLPPFAYTGASRNLDGILRSVHGTDFTSGPPLKRVTTEGMRGADSSFPQMIWYQNEEGVIVTAYKLDAHGLAIPLPKTHGADKVPDGYHILILPREMERPSDQLARERLGRIVLTPLTLAADCVVTPAGLILAILHIIPWKC